MNTAIENRRGHGNRDLPKYKEELEKENGAMEKLEDEKEVTVIKTI